MNCLCVRFLPYVFLIVPGLFPDGVPLVVSKGYVSHPLIVEIGGNHVDRGGGAALQELQ